MRTGTAYLPLHGGKDGTPYPVDRQIYDKSIEILKSAIEKQKSATKTK